MFNIKHRVLDLLLMMLTHLCTSSSHFSFVALRYGISLTKIFRHFKIDLLREQSTTLNHTYTYTYKFYTYISYSLDHSWKAYHRCICTQDIYVYTHDPLNIYFPEVYLGISSIPSIDDDEDKVEADMTDLSDIAPPSNDPLVIDLDASHQACQYGLSRSYASPVVDLEAPLQQITTSIASLFTSMDQRFIVVNGHLTEIQ